MSVYSLEHVSLGCYETADAVNLICAYEDINVTYLPKATWAKLSLLRNRTDSVPSQNEINRPVGYQDNRRVFGSRASMTNQVQF